MPPTQHLGGRVRQISEFLVSLVYRVSSRLARETQSWENKTKHLQNKTKQTKNQKKQKLKNSQGMKHLSTQVCLVINTVC